MQLVGKIMPGLDQADITVIAADRSGGCFTYDIPRGVLCEAFVPLNVKSATVVIEARGYKRFTLNLPTLKYSKDVSRVNVGEITLAKTELPVVRQVIAARRPNGAFRFELTLSNPLARDVLIRRLRVGAHRQGDGSMCCCPPTSVFEISDSLLVTGGGNGELRADGSYIEKVRGADAVVKVTGAIKRFECDESVGVEFDMPVSFVIPKTSVSAVQVVLPKRFNVVKTAYCCTDPKYYPPGLPSLQDGAANIDTFVLFTFALSTTEKDELDIEARYPAAAQH